MNSNQCTQEKIFDRFFGGIFLLVSSFFFAVSATVLPFFGLLPALFTIGLSAAFFRHTPSEVCMLKE